MILHLIYRRVIYPNCIKFQLNVVYLFYFLCIVIMREQLFDLINQDPKMIHIIHDSWFSVTELNYVENIKHILIIWSTETLRQLFFF